MLRRSVVLVAAGCLALAGCGSSGPDSSAANLRPDPGIEDTAAEAGFTDKSADEIVAAAFADMRTLTSVHAKGTVTAEGEGEIGLDLTVAEDACDGTLTFNGAEASIRRVDGTTYLKGGRDLWETFDGEQGSVVAAVVGDRWLDLGDSGSEFDEFCLIEELFYPVENQEDKAPEKGDVSEINGQEAIALKGASEDGSPVTVWIATAPEHFLLRVEIADEGAGSIDLGEFNVPTSIEAPPADDVLDLSALTG